MKRKKNIYFSLEWRTLYDITMTGWPPGKSRYCIHFKKHYERTLYSRQPLKRDRSFYLSMFHWACLCRKLNTVISCNSGHYSQSRRYIYIYIYTPKCRLILHRRAHFSQTLRWRLKVPHPLTWLLWCLHQSVIASLSHKPRATAEHFCDTWNTQGYLSFVNWWAF